MSQGHAAGGWESRVAQPPPAQKPLTLGLEVVSLTMPGTPGALPLLLAQGLVPCWVIPKMML